MRRPRARPRTAVLPCASATAWAPAARRRSTAQPAGAGLTLSMGREERFAAHLPNWRGWGSKGGARLHGIRLKAVQVMFMFQPRKVSQATTTLQCTASFANKHRPLPTALLPCPKDEALPLVHWSQCPVPTSLPQACPDLARSKEASHGGAPLPPRVPHRCVSSAACPVPRGHRPLHWLIRWERQTR